MKRILIALIMAIALVGNAHAWTLSWDLTGVADGSVVSYKPVGPGDYIQVGTQETFLDLDVLSLVPGVRYEFFVNAVYQGSTSAPSDILRWTYPKEQMIIELHGAPLSIIINP